jgi:glycosyltransferase involved in cell wall biosynthesis
MSQDIETLAEPFPAFSDEPKSKRLLILIDRPNWAYARRAEALNKYAPPVFRISTNIPGNRRPMFCRDDETAIVLLLDYASTEYVATIISKVRAEQPDFNPLLVVSFNADANRRQDWWPNIAKKADWVIAVNRQRYEQRGDVKNCCYIPNGVDLDVFKPTVPWSERPNRALWIGTQRSRKIKRYDSILRPLKGILPGKGIECDFRLFGDGDKLMTAEEMAGWYNTGRYILCASESEGTANTITEGAACGCVPISTAVGNIEDWGHTDKSCLYAFPSIAGFERMLCYASEHGKRISALTFDAVQSWGWKERAEEYWSLFRRLVDGGPDSIPPYSYDSPEVEEPDELY